MATQTELIIRTNTITGDHFDAAGNPFGRNTPTASVKSKFRLYWYLYKDTPNAGNAAVNVANWTADSSYAGCGAMVTCDNDYKHRVSGTVRQNYGEDITEIELEFNDQQFFIPESGFLFLTGIMSGTPNKKHYIVPYSSYMVNTGFYTFAVNFNSGAYMFSSGSACAVSQEPFFQSVFDAEASDPANGLFVFDVTAYSGKLAEAAENASGRNIASNGIELLPYIVDADNVYSELPSFLCDSFSLTVNMGEAGTVPEITTEIENQIAAIVNAAVADILTKIEAPHIYQYSSDMTNWHDAFQTGDQYMREKANFEGAEWSDAYPISPPTVFTQAIEYFFETTAGQSAAITFTAAELGIAADAQPQVSLWVYQSDADAWQRVADTTYTAKWSLTDGSLILEYYQAWIAGNWQLKLS